MTEQEEIEIAEHHALCSRRYHNERCYWGEDGWWISCDEVYEIMRRHDREEIK